MSTSLLDANVLIALSVTEHEHHATASAWAAGMRTLGVCPIVEGALVRFLVRTGPGAGTATTLLSAMRATPRYEFWPDDVSYADVDLAGVTGHRQVTDRYLAALAAGRNVPLATFDRALAASIPAHVRLVG